MAIRRAAERDQKIPPIKDKKRRAACESDDCEWLRTYVSGVFTFPFTDDQRLMIEEIGHCLEYGLTKCFAAPRHDGKTSIARYLLLKYALQRVDGGHGIPVPRVPLSLLISATGSKAGKSLSAIKHKLRSRPGSALFDDYPFECLLARYIGPAPARCNNVTATLLNRNLSPMARVQPARPIKMEWGAEHIILPSYEDEGGMGGMLAAMGITSNEIQGFNLYDVRPRFCLLDDLDDRDSLASSDGGSVAAKIETNIDENIAGLGGPGQPLGLVMLCTIPSIHSVAFKYSDPQIKPSWSGSRLKKIKKWPDRTDLWDEYMSLRQAGQQTFDDTGRPVDKYGRKAHEFVQANFDAMHAGAVLSNEQDFNRALYPDGSQAQVSALQNCYDYIIDKGMQSFLTEYQNDPPEEMGPIESGLTAHRIQCQVSGYPRKIVPPDCKVVVQGIDVGKVMLHWVVRAFRSDATGYTIDRDIAAVHGTTRRSDEGLDKAIVLAIKQRMAEIEAAPYTHPDGEIVPVALTLIDASYRTYAIYAACQELGIMSVKPIMGFGKSSGCTQANFSPARKKTRDVHPGDHWNYRRKSKSLWLVEADTDHWKSWEHDRWLTDPTKPGCMFLYGEPSSIPGKLSADQYDHKKYAVQIVAEVEIEEVHKGALRRRWQNKSDRNHWLDASYYADVAANMLNIHMLGALPVKVQTPPDQRPTAQQLAERGRKTA